MVHRYVPILRWKRGERVGVQHLSQGARHDVAPLFVLGTDKYVGKKATKKNPAIPPAQVVAQEIDKIWGKAEFYLDAAALPLNPNGQHPILDIAASARALGLHLIPATTLGAGGAYQQAVDTVVQADGFGVAIRIDLHGVTSAANWVGQWPHQLGDTDLIADFADNVATVLQLGQALDHAFLNLHGGAQWRTVAVGGSNMPDNFAGFQAGLHVITRSELHLWQHLASLGLPYRIDYSDYTTVPTNPPPQGSRCGFPINVRYSLPNDFLICRGVSTTGINGVDMDQQLVGHAQSIAGYGNRGPLANCWGDTEIDMISTTAANQGNLENWVRIGVNRHIELTRTNLP